MGKHVLFLINMNDITNQCEAVLKELGRFSNDVAFLGTAIIDNRLNEFEEKLGFTLPVDFKYIIACYNGVSLDGTEIYGLGDVFRKASLDKIYDFEHFVVENKMPLHFVPFSPDGRGNHYCLDLSQMVDGVCLIKFWQWNFSYNDIAEVETTHGNFVEWINDVMIDWTLEDINYDGSLKK